MPQEEDVVTYCHSHFGYVAAGMLLSAAAITGALLSSSRPVAGLDIMLLALVALLVSLLTFTRLTTVVTARTLRWHFGLGWPRREVEIAEITSIEPVRNPWYYGWGLRLTPVGMLWNVSGTRAVEVRLRRGKRFRIGTDEPQALADAVLEAMPGDR